MFNDKIRLMNQLNQKELILSAVEARNLHNDIFDILNQFISHGKKIKDSKSDELDVNSIFFDGGKF